MTTCIFCGKPTRGEPPEHIVPEGLIGDQPFVVRFGSIIAEPRKFLRLSSNEVCSRCNHKLGQLDDYLQDQLGFLRTYWNHVGTKRGRPSTAARPGMYAERRPDGPHISLNMEKHTIVTPDGIRIPPAKDKEMGVHVKDFKVEGRIATMTIRQPTRMNKRFVRALHKIAFEMLCLNRGPAFVLAQKFDPLRNYILHGRGSREIVFKRSADEGSWEQPHFGLEYRPGTPGWVATIRLGATFFIDLSPNNELVAMADPAQLLAADLVRWSDKDGGKAVTAAA